MSMIEELKEQRKMFQPISEEKIKQVDNAINIAKVNLDSAKSKINNVDKGIIADFDGVITTINVSEGGVGNPGQPAIILENINLKLVVSLGRYDAEKVKLNQEATIKGIDKSYKGRVSFISPAAKGSASAPSIGGINGGGDTTLNIDIDILDKSQDLKINFDADVDLLIGSANNILKIPVEAIINDKDDKNYVFINENGVAKQKEIRIGLQSDTEVQVLQGLKEGEKVILNPGNIIKSGMKIKESVEEEMLEVKNVVKSYINGEINFKALEGVSLK
ncbi:HlyD family efflux transporter periplasmic adaptor subunit [Clostridium bovifaecis]|uniref:HlyD family efflux transporter periplasmic adaptor subunit n=1 Tax=Clostridium bovifaecis TaxID=2184719 RepID=A0A6I6ERL8_9CLOT|nr:HlyD family efflux transporter periplasmic adaptor subunit [Clostridium bovifaecis]